MTRKERLQAIQKWHNEQGTRAYRLKQKIEWQESGLSTFLKEHEVTKYEQEHCWEDCEDILYFDGLKINNTAFFANHPIWDFYDEPLYIREVPIEGKPNHYRLEALQ